MGRLSVDGQVVCGWAPVDGQVHGNRCGEDEGDVDSVEERDVNHPQGPEHVRREENREAAEDGPAPPRVGPAGHGVANRGPPAAWSNWKKQGRSVGRRQARRSRGEEGRRRWRWRSRGEERGEETVGGRRGQARRVAVAVEARSDADGVAAGSAGSGRTETRAFPLASSRSGSVFPMSAVVAAEMDVARSVAGERAHLLRQWGAGGSCSCWAGRRPRTTSSRARALGSTRSARRPRGRRPSRGARRRERGARPWSWARGPRVCATRGARREIRAWRRCSERA